RLAVAALRDLEFGPGLLHRMPAFGIEPLDGRDLGAGHAGQRRYAGARRPAADMDRAGAAHPDPAAELRPGETDGIADHPQQGRVILGLDRHRAAIDVKRSHVRSPMDQLAAPLCRRIAAILVARSGQGGRLVRVRRRYAAIRAMSASLRAPPKAGMTTP